MSEYWRTIEVEVEPQAKSFKIGVELSTTIEDIISAILARCKGDKDLDLEKWADVKVGQQHNFVLLRKGQAHGLMPPGFTLGEITPQLENGESFKFDVRPTVG